MDIMKSVKIGNSEVLKILNDFKDIWWDDREKLEEHYPSVIVDPEHRSNYISNEYKHKIMNMGNAHNGYPEVLEGYDIRKVRDNEFFRKYSELDRQLTVLLSTKNNALCSVYPPGGFIAWHNNANASAYNLIFTWSESGDGYWKHIDPYTGEEVLVEDVPGWQCKAFYFGSYEDDPTNLVYHMASTDCWRMTISYIFDRDHKEFWEDVIEELGTDD